ncbi:MAG: helicase HerA-like domain-containing protein, partial [Anaeromyxobacteraceae bacterium]
HGHYETPIDRESAYEKLRARADDAQPAARPGTPRGGGGGRAAPRGGGDAMDVLQSVAKSAARAAGTQLGREIMRGVFGSIFGGRRR